MQKPSKILLPVDVVHPHPEFLPVLNELVPLAGKHVQLVYVKEHLPAYENILTTLDDVPDDLNVQIESHANIVFSQIRAELEQFGAQVTTEIVSGPTAMMIATIARDGGFELIVVSPGTKSSIDRFLVGSTSAALVTHAPCPILLLKGGASDLGTVVCGLDGSDEAEEALRSAITYFDLSQRAVRLVLVNVVSINNILKYISPARFVGAVEDNLLMAGEAILASGKKICSDLGIKHVDIVLKEGHPASVLLDCAAHENAHLIVVGAQGKGAVERLMTGSVSSRLGAHATMPVAVFRH